jgi:hypothetical protein
MKTEEPERALPQCYCVRKMNNPETEPGNLLATHPNPVLLCFWPLFTLVSGIRLRSVAPQYSHLFSLKLLFGRKEKRIT